MKMNPRATLNAEARLAAETARALQKEDAAKAVKESEQFRAAESQKTERLRALRLAKEAADREAAVVPAPAKPKSRAKARVKSPTIPAAKVSATKKSAPKRLSS